MSSLFYSLIALGGFDPAALSAGGVWFVVLFVVSVPAARNLQAWLGWTMSHDEPSPYLDR